MRVSVIVTTYNNPSFLKKVLDGFSVQTRMPDEVLVADDGSGDDTRQLVEKFVKKVSFPVIHVWQEDNGFRLAKIRNRAIRRSSGDYIIVMDGDCVINRFFIADHEYLAEGGCFIQGKRVLVKKRAVSSFDCRRANSFLGLSSMALTGSLSNIHHLIRLPFNFTVKDRKLKGIKGCNMSFFRKDIEAVNGYNENFVGWGNEDSELACRFFKYGLTKKVHLFMAVCFHLWHRTNKQVSNGNRQLLLETAASTGYFCRNGLLKKH
ncbi:MAG: glycosyltransferase family 2 protein [Candidatus Sulfobium sp.]